MSKKLLPRRLMAGEDGTFESVSMVRSDSDSLGFRDSARRESNVRCSEVGLGKGGSSAVSSTTPSPEGGPSARVAGNWAPWLNWLDGRRLGIKGFLKVLSEFDWVCDGRGLGFFPLRSLAVDWELDKETRDL